MRPAMVRSREAQGSNISWTEGIAKNSTGKPATRASVHRPWGMLATQQSYLQKSSWLADVAVCLGNVQGLA